MMTLNAIRFLSQDPVAAVPAMKTALEFNSPHIDDIRADIGRTVAQALSSLSEKLGKDRSNELLQLAYENLTKNLSLHPLDIRNQLTLSQLAQIGAMLNQNAKYVVAAEELMADALAKSPRRQQVIYSLSALKAQLGKNDEAIKLLDGTITDNSKIGESYWRLAYLYKMLGKMDKVREVLALATKNEVVWDENGQNMLSQILQGSVSSSVEVK